jgi:hypothetical protein
MPLPIPAPPSDAGAEGAPPPPPPPPDPLAPLLRPVTRALRQAGASPAGVFWARVTLAAELRVLGAWVRERLGDTTAAEAVLDEVVRGAQRWLSPGGLAGDLALVLTPPAASPGAATGAGRAAAAGGAQERQERQERQRAVQRLARRLTGAWRPRTDTIVGAALDLALRARAAREGLSPEELVATALGEALARTAAELADSLSLPNPMPLSVPRWPAPRDVWRRLAATAVALVTEDLAREPPPAGWERLAAGLLVPDSGPGQDRGRRGRPSLLPRADKRRVLAALLRQALRAGAPLELLTLDRVAELLDEACARGAIRVEGRRLALPAPLADHALDPELNRRRRRERLRQWLADIGLPRWGEARVALALPATDVLSDIELSNG